MLDENVVDAVWVTEDDGVQVDTSDRLRFHPHPSPPVGDDLRIGHNAGVIAIEDRFAGLKGEMD
jgi:hypothetical protein